MTRRFLALLVAAAAAFFMSAAPDQETVGCMTDLECEQMYGPEESE